MSKIAVVKAREILDSRGNPTIEADVITRDGFMGRAAVPSGASTGSREALELRDNEPDRYGGKGVRRGVDLINGKVNEAVHDLDAEDQRKIDSRLCDLDGSDNKSNLGANTTLAVSLATAKAAAQGAGQPLYQHIAALIGRTRMRMPVPMMNILNGGEHADNNVDIQEFMILPVSMSTFSEALRCGVEVFHGLKAILRERGLSTTVGDEGGFAPNLQSNAQALELIDLGIRRAGYELGKDVALALDCAASEFYRDGAYRLTGEGSVFSSEEFVDYLADLVGAYPILSIEDGLDENDWDGWRVLTDRLGDRIQLVGDDLFVTNTSILSDGIEKGIANSILIKLNQIGTLSETMDAIAMAHDAGYTTVISHRSGETEDTTIADLAVGTGAGQIKTGSLCRSDRVAKYNQLLRIEEILGSEASYLGRAELLRA